MTTTGPVGIFDQIDQNVLGLPDGTRPPLTVHVGSRAFLLSPEESRKVLYGGATGRDAARRGLAASHHRGPTGAAGL